MIDVTKKEGRLSLQDVAELTGKGLTTVYAWARPTDYKGRAKRYLETAMLGGVRYTTRDALMQFQQQGPSIRRGRLEGIQLPQNDDTAFWLNRLRQQGMKV